MVSFIIPAYNAEHYVGESIQSCLDQDNTDIEVIAVNDGSEDNTAAVISRFCAKDKRVRMIDLPHGGKVRAFNAGAAASRGDYLVIQAADDVCMPDRVSRSLEALQEEQDLALVFGQMELVDQELNFIEYSTLKYRNIETWPRPRLISRLLNNNFVSGCTICINKGYKDKIFPIPETLLFEDWWMGLTAAVQGRIRFIPRPLIKYRQHSSNDNSSLYDTGIRSQVEKVKKDFRRHFAYYEVFRSYLGKHISPRRELCLYQKIINYNYLKRKFCLSDSFQQRILEWRNTPDMHRIPLNRVVSLLAYLCAGSLILALKKRLRQVLNRLLRH